MKHSIYTSYDELPLMLSVAEVAAVLGISRAGAYELAHSDGFPALKIGSRIVVPKDKFLAWIDANSGPKNAPLYLTNRCSIFCAPTMRLSKTAKPIGAVRETATGLRSPAGPRRLRNSDTHERIAVPQALCVLRERLRPRPKSGKVCRSDTRPCRVSEPHKTVRG